MTLAATIKGYCEQCAAATLYGGYALGYDRKVIRFEPGHILKRNPPNKATYILVKYSDGSLLEFGQYGYKVK